MENPVIIFNDDYVSVTSHQFELEFLYDDFPNGFIYEFSTEYSGSPLLQINVIRPDQTEILLLSTSLPNSDTKIMHNERIFSTDDTIRKNVQIQSTKMKFYKEDVPGEDLIFAGNDEKILKGTYLFLVNLYGVEKQAKIIDSKLIIGGKAYGIMGTDELRRDIMVGLLWGTPLVYWYSCSGWFCNNGSCLWGICGFQGKKN